ncbi:MAG TPA: hypothetical protein DC054_15760 [Blastocatellia bacterium]|nr:hypothetical protein [Blastocatellia bacterium]
MGKTSYHVIPTPKGGWAVKKEDVSRASRHFETQADAIDWAREEVKKGGGEFVVHKEDGTIRRRDSYAGSPSARDGARP